MTCDSCPKFPHVFSEGDQLPELLGVLKGVDLTNYTVTLRLDRPEPAGVLVKIAQMVDAAQGMFKFVWDSTDLVAGIAQEASITFTDASNRPLTGPKRFVLDVLELPA